MKLIINQRTRQDKMLAVDALGSRGCVHLCTCHRPRFHNHMITVSARLEGCQARGHSLRLQFIIFSRRPRDVSRLFIASKLGISSHNVIFSQPQPSGFCG